MEPDNTEHKSKWWARMVAIHGSEDAVRAFLRESSNKSRRNKSGEGGWAKLKKEDPERLREISKRAAESRWGKRKENEKNTTKEENASQGF